MIFLVYARWKHLLHLAVGVLLRVFKQQLPLNRSFRASCSPPSPSLPPPPLVVLCSWMTLLSSIHRRSSFGTREGLNRRMVEEQKERGGERKGWRKVVREPTKIFAIMTRNFFFFELFTRKELRERES